MHEVLSSGRGKEPFRALVVGRDSRRYLVVSDEPIGVIAGDDIFLTGVLEARIGKRIPREFRVGAVPSERLKKMLKDGAVTKSFGRAVADSPRPLEVALRKLSPLGAAILEVQSKDGVDLGGVFRPARKGKDEILNWGAELVKGLPRQYNLVLLDPKSLLPQYEKGRVTKASAKTEAEVILSRLRTDMPAAFNRKVNENKADWVITGVAHMQAYGSKLVPHRIDQRLVLPYNIFETNSRVWAGYTGLPNNAFSLKLDIDRKSRRYFVTAHELGHGIQDEYGHFTFKRGNGVLDTHLNENFADSFAVLATAQKLGDFESLKKLANLRNAYLVAGYGLSHYSGPSMDVAIKFAEKLDKEGKLADLKPDDLAKMAAKIAKETALTGKEYNGLIKMRAKFYSSLGAYPDVKPLDRITAWHGLLHEVERVKTGQIKEKDSILAGNIWRFERALGAIDEMCYTPKDLRKKSNRREALRFYEDDLKAVLERCEGHQGQARAILDLQHKRYTEQSRNFKKEGGYLRQMEADMMQGRVQIIKKMRRKVNQWDIGVNEAAEDAANMRTTALMIKRRPFKADSTGLKAAFAIAPELRIAAYKKLLFKEIKALRKLESLKADKKAFAKESKKALKLTQKRYNIAFAIRVEKNGRKELEGLKTTNPSLVRHLVAISNNIPHEAKRSDVSKRLKRLEKQNKL